MRVFLTGLVIGGMIGATGAVLYTQGKQVGFRNQAEELKRRARESASELTQRREAIVGTTRQAMTMSLDQAKEMAGRTRSRLSGIRMPMWDGRRAEEASPV